MKETLRLRTLQCARYLVEHNATVRQTAAHFGIGKSTVHSDMLHRLPLLDNRLFEEVRRLMHCNMMERHLRGGESTKRKYRPLSQKDAAADTLS